MVDLPAGCRFAPRCWKTKQRCLDSEPDLKKINARGHRLACWYPLENGMKQ
jgi:oligopeptide/dipeptide ABC transporter ATP-binding protein